MTGKRAGLKSSIVLLFSLSLWTYCYTPPIRKIPEFHYKQLLEKHYREKFEEPFPVVVQPYEEESFFVSEDGYLVYSSDDAGNFDIWLRDLKNILQLKVIEHPAKQTRPFLHKVQKDLYALIFVSYDEDINGDIYITYINPGEIFDAYVAKRIQVNFWNSALNVSGFIEAHFHDNPNCKGKYKEDFPFVVENQNYIYYVSNRCEDTYYLWRIPFDVKKGKVTGKPEIALKIPLYYPSYHDGSIVFTYLQDNDFTSRIGIWNLKTGEVKTVTPKLFEKPLEGIAILPKIHPQFRQIYFIYIEKDTNGNRKLDPYDKAALFRFEEGSSSPAPILTGDYRILDFQLSSYLEDSIFYISDIYGEYDIFLTFSEGIIPNFGTPLRQYDFALQNKDKKNYPLLLQSVLNYFSRNEELRAIEGEIIFELRHYYSKKKDREKEDYYRKLYEVRKSENPVLPVFYKLKELEVSSVSLLQKKKTLENLEAGLLALSPDNYTKNYFYYRAGSLLYKEDKKTSLSYFAGVDKDFEKYPEVRFYFLQAEQEKYRFSKSLDKEELEILTKNPEFLVQFSDSLIEDLEKLSLSRLQEVIQGEDGFIKNHALYVLSRKYIRLDDYRKGLEVLQEIKELNRSEYRYLHLLVLSQKIYIYKKLGMEKELLEARSAFLFSYDKDLGVEIGEDEIEGLINASFEFVTRYRKSARLIYRTLQNQLLETNRLLQDENITITAIDRDNLEEFCAPDSLAGSLIDQYDYREYEKRYENLCKSFNGLRDKNKIPAELAFEANQLMYLTSYAYANLINLLFINVYKKGSFQDYYRKWSVFYHRLKIDLSAERFSYLIDWEEKRALFFTQRDLTNILIEKDPFAGTIFDDLLYGYRVVAFEEALKNFDYSVLYGHAYTLIRKSVERELFYDSLFRKGYSLSDDELLRRKRDILLELKEAEYILQYILILDPANEDAALLLSFLYSYIDYRKELSILNRPGYLDRFIRYVTGVRPKKITDGVFYRDLYRTTFPERLYEKNIVLLENLVSMKGLKKEDVSQEVYLNLGLNYYQVRNYRKTVENFEKIKDYLWNEEETIQRAMFYFYFAKASFFENRFESALSRLNTSYDLFYAIYREKVKEYNVVRIKLEDRQGIALFQNNVFQNNLQELYETEVRKWRNIIFALRVYKTLINFYAKNYNDAILEVNRIVEDLRNEEEIKGYNVYNFMALNYLYQFDLEKAIRVAAIAMEHAEKEGLKRNEEIFIPQTLGGRLLGLIMNFGEDFAVVGPGRMPYEISSLRSYLVSLGIQNQSYLEMKNVENILKTIKTKKEVIKKYDFDVRLGREAYISLLNQEGTIYFHLKDYKRAYASFKEAYELAYKFQFTEDYYKNFKNSFYVVFQHIEEDFHKKSEHKTFLSLLDTLQERLLEFKKNYFLIRKNEYEKSKKVENPDYKLTENDYAILKEQIEFELLDFYHISALLIYYRGILLQDRNLIQTAQKELQKLLKIYDKKDRDILYYRISQNYLKTSVLYRKLESGPIDAALLEEMQNLYDEILGFDMPVELVEMTNILGDAYIYQKKWDTAKQYYEQLWDYLNKNSNFSFIPEFRLEEAYYNYIKTLIATRELHKIPEIYEKYRFYTLHNYFLKQRFFFPGKEDTEIFSQMHRLYTGALALKQLEIQHRFQKKPAGILRNQLKSTLEELQKQKQVFVKKYPKFRDVLFYAGTGNLHTLPYQAIYLFSLEDGDVCITAGKKTVIMKEIRDLPDIDSCVFRDDVVLLADKRMYQTSLARYYRYLEKKHNVVIRTSLNENYPVYLTKLPELAYVSGKNLFNNGKSFFSNLNEMEWKLTPPAFLSGCHHQGIAYNFRNPFTASTIRIKEDTEGNSGFESLFLAYEFYQKLGVSTFIDTGSLVWGIKGYDENTFSLHKKKLANEYFTKGISLFRSNPGEALLYFQLSDAYREDIKTKIYILGSLIRTRNPLHREYRKKVKEEILASASPSELYRYYVMVINSFALMEEYRELSGTVEELRFLSSDPRFGKLQKSAEILLELAKPSPSYRMIEELIAGNEFDTSLREAIIPALQKHGFFYLASKLASQEEFREELIKGELYLALLQAKDDGGSQIRRLLAGRFQDENLQTFQLVLENQYDTILQKLRNAYSQNFHDKRYVHRIQFFEFLKMVYQEKILNLEQFLCLEKGENKCSSLTDGERLLLLHFSSKNIPYDNQKILYTNITGLLSLEFEKSCYRGILYLSRVMREYIRNFEYKIAYSLYEKYKTKYECVFHNETSNFIDEIIMPLIILRGLQYKVDDNLIIRLAQAYPRIIPDVEGIIRLLSEEENKLVENFQNFPWKNVSKLYHQNIYDIVLSRLLKSKNYREFQNVAFLKEQEHKTYKDKVGEIKAKLLENEDFLSIVEFDGNFYLCSAGEISCSKLPFDARDYRMNLQRYFFEKQYFQSDYEKLDYLVDLYAKIEIPRRNKAYVWWNGVHKLAPVTVKENMYSVFYPLDFEPRRTKFVIKDYPEFRISQEGDGKLLRDLRTITGYMNLFRRERQVSYVTSRPSARGGDTVMLAVLEKKRISLFEDSSLAITLPKNNGVLIMSNTPYGVIKIFTKTFSHGDFSLQQRFQRTYREFALRNDFTPYFMKAYVHSYVE